MLVLLLIYYRSNNEAEINANEALMNFNMQMEGNSEHVAHFEQGERVRYNWVDVTDEMRLACKELNLGELVHDAGLVLKIYIKNEKFGV